MPKNKNVQYYERRIARVLKDVVVFITDNVDDPQLCGKYINDISRCGRRNIKEQYETLRCKAECIKREILKSKEAHNE
jgi:hypothetical protein